MSTKKLLHAFSAGTWAVVLGVSVPAEAGLTDCAISWDEFANNPGFTADYTFKGEVIADYEEASDPSHGPAAVSPAWTDIASASPADYPGPAASAIFGYYNGGTAWNPMDPATLEDDYLLFRMRVQGDPKHNAGFDSKHWNILFDVDDDGYKEFWIDLDGSVANNSNPDNLKILYDNSNRQDIADPVAAQVNVFIARHSPDLNAACPAPSPGRSHTRTYAVGDGTPDWYIDMQVPVTALNDSAGNQVMFPDSPVAFVYSTGASNQDPLQKDFMMDLGFLTLADPITFGDIVIPNGQPKIDFVDADLNSVGSYTIGDNVYIRVQDRFANVDPNVPECISVAVANPATGDDETVTLCETGPNTGIFTNRGGACSAAITFPSPAPDPVTAWIRGIKTSDATVAETWSATYSSTLGTWQVAGSVSGVQATRASDGAAYVSNTGGVSFTLYHNSASPPSNGTVLTFCTVAADPVTTSSAAGVDDDSDLQGFTGDGISVSYTNPNSVTVTDTAKLVAPCVAVIEFTRANGLPSNNFQLGASVATSDKLYVTVTLAEANTNPLTAQTIQVTLTGNDTQTLTLTETGIDTGVFRNVTGLDTKIDDGVVTPNDGLWEDIDEGVVTAVYDYACGGSPYSVSATASLFATGAGGRVAFTNGAGTVDVDTYTSGQPVFVKVTDATACTTTVAGVRQFTVVVTSTAGDSETITVFETAPNSGVFMNRRNDLVTTAGSATVSSASAPFTAGMVGGVFVVASGPDVGLYTVASFVSATQITLDRPLSWSRTGIAFTATPLMSAVSDGTQTANDRVLEADDGDDLTVAYSDCNDGDGNASNDVKQDTAKFSSPTLMINRVMFYPDASTNCQTEYVEVYNSATVSQTATGYSIRDVDMQLDFTIPQLNGADISLAPGERVLVSIGGDFPDFYDSANGIYYVFESSASYPSDVLGDPAYTDAGDRSDQVLLADLGGTVVDYVAWSSTLSPSLDFFSDDTAAVLRSIWQDDAFKNVATMAVGERIQRVSDGFDTNTPSDWTLVGDSVCQDIIDAYALTRATLLGLRVDPAGLVEFATGTQKGTVSFRLYETSDFSAGELVPLHDDPIASPVRDSVEPILYSAAVRPFQEPLLVIEETDSSGRHTLLGPFEIFDASLAEALARIEERLDRLEVPRGQGVRFAHGASIRRYAAANAGNSRTSGASRRWSGHFDGATLTASGPGTLRLPLSELEPFGLQVRGKGAVAALRISSQGREVPYSRRLTPSGEELVLVAEGQPTDYSSGQVFVLTWGRAAPPPSVSPTRSVEPPAPGFVRVERSFVYLAAAPLGTDPWLWDVLFTGGGTWPYAWWDPSLGTFDVPGLVPGSGTVPVRLRLLGRSDHTHTVRAHINGAYVGSVTFAGSVPAVLEGELPADALHETGNALTLDYEAETAGNWDWGLIYLDSLDIGVDALAGASAATVVALEPWDATLPDLRGVEYLVVTHAAFREQADRLAALKRADGLSTTVVDVQRAYDRYSGGMPEPRAVQALLREAGKASPGLRFVVLVGDDTLDPRDYLGLGSTSYVPSLLGWDGQFGRIPSENAFADLDGDGRPDLAIGRLPVQTVEQAEAIVDKIAHHRETLRANSGRHLFVVDNQTPGQPDFRAAAQAVADGLQPGSVVQWADVAHGVQSARLAMESALAQGAAVTHYFGHGGPEVWTDEGLLRSATVHRLEGTKPTIVLAWACQAQWYLNLWGPSVSEALLLLPDSGALASFGPAGISPTGLQRTLSIPFYQAFLGQGSTLGEAALRAKNAALDADPAAQAVVEGWNLLGDPALRLTE